MTTLCLIAEADLFIANLLERFAEESGMASARAKTGEEILPLVQRLKPDVLIVEPELPGAVRGWKAVQNLQLREAAGRMAVVSCSWLNQVESSKLIGDVAAHLQKPDLRYVDFVSAMAAAGVAVTDETDGRQGLLGDDGE